jgi:hypothetical protein
MKMYIINMHSFEKKLNVWHVQEQLQEHLYQVAIQKQLDLSLKALRDQHLNQNPSSHDVAGVLTRTKNKKRVKCTIL